MPETAATVETPGEKLMRQWYAGKLTERLIQTTSMKQSRDLLRRGAKKMQDGTLGTFDESGEGGEPVNINIGDQIIHQAATEKPTPPENVQIMDGSTTSTSSDWTTSTSSDWLKKALVSAALVASGAGAGAGIPWLAGMFDKPAAVEAPTFDDTNTQYELSIKP